MNAISAPARRSAWLHIAAGGLAMGTLDLVFACLFWGLLRGVAPERILQSIAAGLQGPAAFQGGGASAVLGAACHYGIATSMVLAYYLASARHRALVLQPVRHGLAYGLLLYAVMTWIVVPLSNAPPANAYPPWVLASIAMHMVLGVVCAWYARRARGL